MRVNPMFEIKCLHLFVIFLILYNTINTVIFLKMPFEIQKMANIKQ